MQCKLNFENNEKFGKMNSENKIGNEKLPLKVIQSKNLLIFSSIANPAVFYQTIKKLNPNNIEEIKFSDHHVYTRLKVMIMSWQQKRILWKLMKI